MTNNKPWPRDVLIIAAENAGNAAFEQMKTPVNRHCRDCGQHLHVDLVTIQVAWERQDRCGRPIDFLCLHCVKTYDMRNVKFVATKNKYPNVRAT